MILRDDSGGIIFCSCRHLFTCDDVLEAEILAIREGLMLAGEISGALVLVALPVQRTSVAHFKMFQKM